MSLDLKKEHANGTNEVTNQVPKQDVNEKNNNDDNDDYDEEEDDDYNPDAREDVAGSSSDDDDDDDAAKYKSIESAEATQVRTRNQRYQEKHEQASDFRNNIVGSVSRNMDFDSIFNDLKKKSTEGKPTNWSEILGLSEVEQQQNKASNLKQPPALKQAHETDTASEQQGAGEEVSKIRINVSYAFAGKVVTESKLVDANSAEAKAYLNSTSGLQLTDNNSNNRGFKSHVPVIRTVKGYDEPLELKIKLKRPSLIDKFMATQGNKYQKLSTLEKSRLDWASYVDTNKINDELKLHNKDGYLEKQLFLDRVHLKRDEHYNQAKEVDRAKRWQEQQKQP